MTAPKFTLTNSSVLVIWEGMPYIFQVGTPNFAALRAAILDERWDDIPKCLTVASSIETWAKGEFTVKGEAVFYKGEALPTTMNKRVIDMASRGEDPTPVFNFWARLKKNPSNRSVESLFGFLEHVGIPFDKDGFIVAYKGVRQDFKDCHTGTLDNHPGVVQEYDRNKVSDDPRTPCHEGLHVGALSYASSFGARVVIVKVDPEHVVCVPYDESARKVRVCKYEVLGLYTGQLSDTTFDENDAPKAKAVVKSGKDKGKVKPLKGVKNGKAAKVSYEDLDAMDEGELLEQSTDVIRAYAANHLKMVGASKIPGGKAVLIHSVLEVRASL